MLCVRVCTYILRTEQYKSDYCPPDILMCKIDNKQISIYIVLVCVTYNKV